MAATTEEPPLLHPPLTLAQPSEDTDHQGHSQSQGQAPGPHEGEGDSDLTTSSNNNSDHNNKPNTTTITITTIPDVVVVQAAEEEQESLQTHRLNHTPSKLPSFRFADRDSLVALGASTVLHNNKQPQPGPPTHPHPQHPSLPVQAVSPHSHTGPGPAGIDSTPISAGTPHHNSAQNTSAIPENSTTVSASASAPPSTTSAPPPPLRRLLPPTTLSPVTETNDANSASSQLQDTSDDSPHSVISPFEDSPRSRTSTNRTVSTSAPVTPPTTTTTTTNKRSALFHGNGPTSSPPDADHSQTDAGSPSFWTPASRPRTRRASSSRASSLARSPIINRTPSKDSLSPGSAIKPWAPNHQEEPISPKANNGSPPDENRRLQRRSSASRPPLSYRPIPGTSIPGRPTIPPIRSFRPSESRRNSQVDMTGFSSRSYDDGDDYHDPQARDRSLRALEGRQSNEWRREDDEAAESENNTADIFMRIAREDSSSSLPRRRPDGRGDEDRSSVVSRITRNPRQRPMSTIYTSSMSQAASSSSTLRRLSDHQITTPHRRRTGEDISDQYSSSRDLTYQSVSTEKPTLKLDAARVRSNVPALKPSPITPRTQSVLDASDRSSISARRPPTTEHSRSRSTSIRQPTSLSKSFNSSPHVRKNPEPQQPAQQPAMGHPEASESSNSTAAPSTVWDELDELKSRINRLELTGKLPKTSHAAISRASEERPPTAGTGATTISGSPKRAGTAPTEVQSTASSHQSQPILKSALSKTKPFVSSEVFDAIEAAAADALSLAQIMGTAGQPGPISSGASTIGTGGASTVTDRQLRKKADSICRNLTELCLALKEEGSQRKNVSRSRPQTRKASRQRSEEPPSSPPMRVFTGASQQRQLARPDEVLPSIETASSPRTMRFDKRATFNFTGMSGPASASEPAPIRSSYAPSIFGGEESGRKSSLIVARSRRGVTEDPEDPGRRTSLLRTRRAGTDEPADDSRKSSLVLTPRRVTTIGRVSNIDEEPQVASRVPSRAITDVSGGLRITVPRRSEGERGQQTQEPSSATAMLPRRRLLTTNLPTPGPYTSRLATPTTPSARRFLQIRGVPEDNRGDATERLAEERSRYSIGGTTASGVGVGRTTSLHRKRASGAASFSGTASNVGGYR